MRESDMSPEELTELQAEHDEALAATREAEQEQLATNEAANYLRVHDAEAAQEYANLMATRTEIHQPQNIEE